ASSCRRMVSEMRCRGMSTDSTLTLTTSPDLATSRGSATKLFDIAETWTRPSWWTPMSTNAPKAATFVTTPSRTMPGSRSPRVCTPSAQVAAWLFEFLKDVGDRGQAERLVGELGRVEPAQRLAVADEGRHIGAGLRQDAADHRVRLGVHARGVERVVA